MNVFSVVIIGALVLEYAFGLVADVLNLRALKPEAPADLRDVYDPDRYGKSQAYTRVTTRFGLVTGAFRLLLLLGFWFTGGFELLDEAVRGWGFSTVPAGVLYVGSLLLGYMLVSEPFSIYATFVIEERFGFNKTTWRTYIADRVKGLALAALIGGPLLAGILALFEYAGGPAWLYAWAAVSLFALGLQYVAPRWILPLFNKYTPLEPGELREAIFGYARNVDFGVDNIFLMDGSKRSGKSNAFFTGFGRHMRIALFDTLVEQHTVPELVAVLAHEIGHYKKKHILLGTVIGIAHTGLLFFLLSLFIGSSGMYEAFYMERMPIYAGLLYFGLLYTPIEFVLSAAQRMLSRKHEYDADRWAAETVEHPERLVDGLKKLAANNLSNLAPHPFYVFLNHSHPPLLQRAEAISRASARLEVGQGPRT